VEQLQDAIVASCCQCEKPAMVQSDEGNDGHIAQLIREGDEQGFALLLEQYAGRISRYLRKRFPTFDDHDLNDLLVDAALALGETFDPRRGTLGAWFLLLAHQGAVSRLRASRENPATLRYETDVAAHDPSPLAKLMYQERLSEVQHAMASLASLERAVVEADLEQGETANARQLAERFNTTEGSVYAARQRGRRKLLDKLSWLHNER
jgi:RNA polymerase sigma factor (sigma-70 family)